MFFGSVNARFLFPFVVRMCLYARANKYKECQTFPLRRLAKSPTLAKPCFTTPFRYITKKFQKKRRLMLARSVGMPTFATASERGRDASRLTRCWQTDSARAEVSYLALVAREREPPRVSTEKKFSKKNFEKHLVVKEKAFTFASAFRKKPGAHEKKSSLKDFI